MFYIYVIQNIINNKVYIGKTNNPKLRFTDHLRVAKQRKTEGRKTFNLIHKAINKYGEGNFTFQVIEEFLNENDAFEAEKFWIEFFRSNVNKFGNNYGYNLTDGGEGNSGFIFPPEFGLKISKALTGRVLTKEHKENIGKANKENWKHNPSSNPLDRGTKINWPTDIELIDLVKSNGYTGTAKILSVSNVAVRERLKRRGFYPIKKN